jgi:hypothetical protein
VCVGGGSESEQRCLAGARVRNSPPEVCRHTHTPELVAQLVAHYARKPWEVLYVGRRGQLPARHNTVGHEAWRGFCQRTRRTECTASSATAKPLLCNWVQLGGHVTQGWRALSSLEFQDSISWPNLQPDVTGSSSSTRTRSSLTLKEHRLELGAGQVGGGGVPGGAAANDGASHVHVLCAQQGQGGGCVCERTRRCAPPGVWLRGCRCQGGVARVPEPACSMRRPSCQPPHHPTHTSFLLASPAADARTSSTCRRAMRGAAALALLQHRACC